jgi:hypothetical protein
MDLTGTLILAGIGLLIGFLVGALIFYTRRGDSESDQSRGRRLTKARRELGFWWEGEDDHLVLEIDGATYRRGSELRAEQKHRLRRLKSDLETWVEIPPPSPAIQQEVSKPEPAPPVDDARQTSLNPFSIFTRSFRTAERAGPDEAEKSIVEQIDEILQAKLEGTPFEERGIRLVEGSDQGMLIEVGLDRYRDIDSIPDEAVRQILRASVAEWEDQSAK